SWLLNELSDTLFDVIQVERFRFLVLSRCCHKSAINGHKRSLRFASQFVYDSIAPGERIHLAGFLEWMICPDFVRGFSDDQSLMIVVGSAPGRSVPDNVRCRACRLGQRTAGKPCQRAAG